MRWDVELVVEGRVRCAVNYDCDVSGMSRDINVRRVRQSALCGRCLYVQVDKSKREFMHFIEARTSEKRLGPRRMYPADALLQTERITCYPLSHHL
jgi:hypothetical protein